MVNCTAPRNPRATEFTNFPSHDSHVSQETADDFDLGHPGHPGTQAPRHPGTQAPRHPDSWHQDTPRGHPLPNVIGQPSSGHPKSEFMYPQQFLDTQPWPPVLAILLLLSVNFVFGHLRNASPIRCCGHPKRCGHPWMKFAGHQAAQGYGGMGGGQYPSLWAVRDSEVWTSLSLLVERPNGFVCFGLSSGQVLVKFWSSVGQVLVKLWSSYGQNG